jgi:Peptidase family M23
MATPNSTKRAAFICFWFLLLCGYLMLGLSVHAQTFREMVKVDPIQLSAPIDGEFYISGTFGEPRPNHYHSGMDIKTGGVIGWQVKTVDDGYVSRIKVSAGGYGKALYISHPNGLTSVYAHLDRFAEPIADFVKKAQYQRESFEIDTILPKNVFPFKKGDMIALSGNTGGSAGPHLHFEVRETLSSLALNPMRFGFSVKDSQAPVIGKVKVYPFSKSFYEHQGITLTPVQRGNIWQYEASVPEGKFVLSVEAFDQQDLTPEHKNGVPILRMLVDSQLVFSRTTDTVDFSLTRYVHATIDYAEKVRTGKDFYLFFRLPGNLEGDPYRQSPSDGVLNIKAGQQKKVFLELSDYHGNLSKIQVVITGTLSSNASKTFMASPYESGSIALKAARLSWRNGSFYDRPLSDIEVEERLDTGALSHVYKVFTNTNTAIHKSLTLEVSDQRIPSQLKSKCLMVLENAKGTIKPLVSNMSTGNRIQADFNEPGKLYVAIDTISPEVSALNYSVSSGKFSDNKIQLKMTDNLSGIQFYRGMIDGKWVLFEYDAKTSTLEYVFDENVTSGEHQLQFDVTDVKQNKTTFILPFKN